MNQFKLLKKILFDKKIIKIFEYISKPVFPRFNISEDKQIKKNICLIRDQYKNQKKYTQRNLKK